MFQQTAKELIAFIEKSPTCFQAVCNHEGNIETGRLSGIKRK